MSQAHRSVSIGALDISGPEKDFILVTGWLLDATLDPVKVENAFAKLVDVWPVLSARLRTKPDGSWEYQIPTEFSAKRPKYIFKSVTKAGNMAQTYPLPTPSKEISSHIVTHEPHMDLFAEGGPRSMKDYLKKDIPLIQLQLTNFEDGCILGLTTPHLLCDGHGNKEIGIALSRLMKGEDVLPLKEGDPLGRYTHNTEPPKAPSNWKVLGIFQMVVMIACMIWNLISARNVQSRVFYIPASEAKRIKAEAMADLKRERPDDKDAWVSTSDAIGAFLLKNTYASCTSQKPLNVVFASNVRNILPDLVPSPYLNNGACAIPTPTMRIADVANKSLGEMAYICRQTIRKWTQPESMEGWLRWRFANAGKPMVFFEPTGAFNVVTNWREMKLMHIDFSGGLPADAAVEKAHCIYGYAGSFAPWPVQNMFGILHDDPRGGIWVSGVLPQSAWERPEGFGKFCKPS
ncbi:hypothetical protein FRC15_004392 [Serendipita sp. 397]|nr:hypothetical protein FRC15_004392 [Serendipita sp. 397]KAG8839351.1 hypothetical protein FRC18_011462 [Serendipita sp. 400]